MVGQAAPEVADRAEERVSRRAALAAAGAGMAAALAPGGPAQAQSGKLAKEVVGLGMPWEEQYGYAQAVKIGDVVYVSGQLSHDEEGQMVAPAPLDASAGSPITATWARRWPRATPTSPRCWARTA